MGSNSLVGMDVPKATVAETVEARSGGLACS